MTIGKGKNLKAYVRYNRTRRGVLTHSKPFKPLLVNINRSFGRSSGKIVSKLKCSGHKKMYRIIDFFRNKFNIEGVVSSIEYDPFRSAYISLIKYKDESISYIISPEGIKCGDVIMSSLNIVDIRMGNATVLLNIPVGILIHNVESKPGGGGKYSRSAGSYMKIMGFHDNGYVSLKMTSGEIKYVNSMCLCTIGIVSNVNYRNLKLYKAGNNILRGKRPKVRGVAMNTVDHPHGGSAKSHTNNKAPRSATGVLSKGYRTRNKRKSNKFIVSRRK